MRCVTALALVALVTVACGDDGDGASVIDAAPPQDAAATDVAAPQDAVVPTDAPELSDTLSLSDAIGSDTASVPDTATTTDTATAADAEPVPDTAAVTDTAGPTDTAAVTDTAGPAPDPAALGPFAVTKTTVTLAGFDVVLHVPDGPGPFPTVLFSPGFQLDAVHFEDTGAYLASHGFFTAIPTWGDSFLAAIPHSDLADHVSAILDALVADSRVDPEALAAGGHSRGGKVAILAATRDARIKASFNLDPVDSAGGPGAQPSAANPSVTPELMGQFTIPGGFVGSAKGASGVVPCAPTADNYAAYAAHAAGEVFVELIAGSGHNDFADSLPFLLLFACTGGDAPATTRSRARALMTAFYYVHLVGDERLRDFLTP